MEPGSLSFGKYSILGTDGLRPTFDSAVHDSTTTAIPIVIKTFLIFLIISTPIVLILKYYHIQKNTKFIKFFDIMEIYGDFLLISSFFSILDKHSYLMLE